MYHFTAWYVNLKDVNTHRVFQNFSKITKRFLLLYCLVFAGILKWPV